tara:strand:+ start:46 stop:1494 length:1449 start_codon:yes stop_codon:yes gene_type:complete
MIPKHWRSDTFKVMNTQDPNKLKSVEKYQNGMPLTKEECRIIIGFEKSRFDELIKKGDFIDSTQTTNLYSAIELHDWIEKNESPIAKSLELEKIREKEELEKAYTHYEIIDALNNFKLSNEIPGFLKLHSREFFDYFSRSIKQPAEAMGLDSIFYVEVTWFINLVELYARFIPLINSDIRQLQSMKIENTNSDYLSELYQSILKRSMLLNDTVHKFVNELSNDIIKKILFNIDHNAYIFHNKCVKKINRFNDPPWPSLTEKSSKVVSNESEILSHENVFSILDKIQISSPSIVTERRPFGDIARLPPMNEEAGFFEDKEGLKITLMSVVKETQSHLLEIKSDVTKNFDRLTLVVDFLRNFQPSHQIPQRDIEEIISFAKALNRELWGIQQLVEEFQKLRQTPDNRYGYKYWSEVIARNVLITKEANEFVIRLNNTALKFIYRDIENCISKYVEKVTKTINTIVLQAEQNYRHLIDYKIKNKK